MTLDQAAAELGIRWRIVRARMVELGWLRALGDNRFACGPAGTTGGYVAPRLVESGTPGRKLLVETGYQVTPKGVARLRASFAER